MRRVLLFISSYLPLYLLLVGKNIVERLSNDSGTFGNILERFQNVVLFDEINDFAICTLLLLTVTSLIYLIVLLRRKQTQHFYVVKHISDQSGSIYFNYISVYLLSCIGLSLEKVADVFVLLFLMVIVGYIYISNRMTYMNPIVQLLGYKIYEMDIEAKNTPDSFESIVIAPCHLHIVEGDKISGSGKEDFILVK